MDSTSTMLGRLTEAQNAHDAESFASCFAADYVSAQPAHPERAFTGRGQVLENWAAVFAGVPDFRAEVLACSVDGESEWGEVDWRGHHGDGAPFAMRGVIIIVVRDGLVVEGRLYVEPVDQSGQDIAASVRELSRPPAAGDA